MKKYLLFGLLVAIFPGICSAADHRFTQLVREKQRKMAELEKCTGSTKGLKIAGISTLGLSAAGVAVNIAEAKKIKEYDKKIEDVPNQLKKLEKQLAETETKTEYAKNCTDSDGKIDGRDKCICKGNKKPDPNGTCKEEKLEDNSSEERLVDDNKEDKDSNDLYCSGTWSVSEYSTRNSVEGMGSYFCARDNTCICDDADDEEIYRGVSDDCCNKCDKACAKAFEENQ